MSMSPSLKLLLTSESALLFDPTPLFSVREPEAPAEMVEKKENAKGDEKKPHHTCVYDAFLLLRNVANIADSERAPLCLKWREGIELTDFVDPADLKTAAVMAKFYRQRSEVNGAFLKSLGKDPKKEAQTLWKAYLQDSFEQDPHFAGHSSVMIASIIEEVYPLTYAETVKQKPFFDEQLLEATATCHMGEAFGLKRSPWVPGKTAQSLVETLKKQGPILILGNFGTAFYVEKPKPLQKKIGEHHIYAWKPGSKRVEQPLKHAVLVVGSSVEKQSQKVYFVDPGVPKALFAISYKNLRDNIIALYGPPLSVSIHTAKVGYGFYNPTFKE